MTNTKNPKITVSFIAGLLVGVVGAIFVPRIVQSALSTTGLRQPQLIPGMVSAKRPELDRLLLTITTSEGSILATFTEDIPAIDLLVNEGDSITLETDGYEPFFDNPAIARVRTVGSPVPAPLRDSTLPADTSVSPSPPLDTMMTTTDTAMTVTDTAMTVTDTAMVVTDTLGGPSDTTLRVPSS
jgi:hypothetical protein